MNRNLPKTILVGILFALSVVPLFIVWLIKPPRNIPENGKASPNESMAKRDIVMRWWSDMNSAQKTQICDTNTEIIGHVRRWETLTGNELEALYDAVTKTS